jgi:hypothetical protein
LRVVPEVVIASPKGEAIQRGDCLCTGLLQRFAPRNDSCLAVSRGLSPTSGVCPYCRGPVLTSKGSFSGRQGSVPGRQGGCPHMRTVKRNSGNAGRPFLSSAWSLRRPRAAKRDSPSSFPGPETPAPAYSPAPNSFQVPSTNSILLHLHSTLRGKNGLCSPPFHKDPQATTSRKTTLAPCLLPVGAVRDVQEAAGRGRGTGGPDPPDTEAASLPVREPPGEGRAAPGAREAGKLQESGRPDAEERVERPGEAEVRPHDQPEPRISGLRQRVEP